MVHNEAEEQLSSSKEAEEGDSTRQTNEVPDGGFTAWVQVASTFCIYLNTWGVANMYGVFQAYYQLNILQTETASNIAWIGSMQGSLLLLTTLVAGPIYDAGYMRGLTFLGSLLTILSIMLTSICTTYWEFVLAQGLAFGLGSGLLYLPGASIISQYFQKKKAIAFGIASMGSSIGAIIFPILFRQLEPQIGFGWTIRVIAFVMLGISIIPIVGMKQRIPTTGFHQTISLAHFKDVPFLLFCLAEFFAFMGIYVAFFYVQLYSLSECHTSPRIGSLLLAIINAGSFFGRLVPNYISDKVTGPMNMQIPFAFIASILSFGWIGIHSTSGLIVFCILYGFASGTFVSLGGPICFNLTPDLGTVGTRLGMVTAVCGVGLLVGTPIAGAILDSGSWIGLQIWAGLLLLLSALLQLAARVAKQGWSLSQKI